LSQENSYQNLTEDIYSRALTHALADRIFIIDHNGVILDFKINTENSDHTGGYKGRNLFELFHDDPGVSKSALPLIRKAISERQTEVFRFVSPLPQKVQFNEIRFAFLDENRILVLHKNIEPLVSISAQLFKNQVLLRALIENNDDTIFALDHEMRYILFNHVHKNAMMKKYGKEIELGRSIVEYVQGVDEDMEKGRQMFEHALKGETLTFEADFGDKGMFRGNMMMNVFPLKNEINKIFGFAVFAKDLALQKKIQEQRDHYVSTMEKMVSDLSHKLRKPVATMLGLIQLIDDEKNEADLKKILAYLRESTAEMDDCIKQMTSFIEGRRDTYK
jgi:hypothetical protein